MTIMDPFTQCLQAIAQEIKNDPANLGYAGKTPQQQADLMNNPYSIMVPQVQTARIAQIINQIPFAPNISTVTDVQNSQVAITPNIIISTAQEVTASQATLTLP